MAAFVDPLRPAAIRAALATLDPVFASAPQFVHDGLSERAGRPVVVKVETVNPIRSFKGRGTWHAVRELVGEGALGPDRPLVAASTGNFGQGVAYAGRSFGVPVTVFADERANPRKLDRIRALGATVRQAGHDFDAAREAAESHARAAGAWLLVDGESAAIAVGAGTLAVEVSDGVGGRPAAIARDRLRPGRQRLADRRGRRLAALGGTRLHGRRDPVGGRAVDDPVVAERPADRDRDGRHVRRRDRDPGAGPRGAGDDEGSGRRRCAWSRNGRSARPRPS